MIEIINAAAQAIIVDSGRYGFSDIGVPHSSALDMFSYKAVNFLTGNEDGAPAIESFGSMFSMKFHEEMVFAVTGAWVDGVIDEIPFTSWRSIRAKRGSIMKIKRVYSGFRYYIGFSGKMDIDQVMGSYTTNLECCFGGLDGRPLKKGDLIRFSNITSIEDRFILKDAIPSMDPPHTLRIIDGPEIDYFTDDAIEKFFGKKDVSSYVVSTKSNRTGIRLEGNPVEFKEGVEKSIISEGILPGTIQIPGDGMPVIVLNERTLGGYARIASVAKVDQDMLAHLKPKDKVILKRIDIEEADTLWNTKQKLIKNLLKNE